MQSPFYVLEILYDCQRCCKRWIVARASNWILSHSLARHASSWARCAKLSTTLARSASLLNNGAASFASSHERCLERVTYTEARSKLPCAWTVSMYICMRVVVRLAIWGWGRNANGYQKAACVHVYSSLTRSLCQGDEQLMKACSNNTT